MTDSRKDKNTSFKEVSELLKKYISLESDYAQITLVEKITKILSVIIIALLTAGFSLGLLFYILFALAYFLIPLVGEVASFGIVGGLFLLSIIILALFKNALIVNPILRAVIKAIGDKTVKRRKEDSDEYNETIG